MLGSGRPRPGNVGAHVPVIGPAVYRPPSGVRKKTTSMMGGQMFAEGGEAKKYPNKGLEALAKEAPEVVKRMGYKNAAWWQAARTVAKYRVLGNVDVVDGKPRGTKFVGTR